MFVLLCIYALVVSIEHPQLAHCGALCALLRLRSAPCPLLVPHFARFGRKLGLLCPQIGNISACPALSIPAGSKEGSLVLPVNGCRALRAGLKPLSQWEWSRGWGCPVPQGLGISLEDRRLLSKPTHPGKAQLFALRQAKGFLCGTETISGLIFVSPASQQSAIDLGR